MLFLRRRVRLEFGWDVSKLGGVEGNASSSHHLLTRDDLTIKEIAHLAGFASPFQFSKTFKQFFRQSPSTCRKIMLRNFQTSGALLAETKLG